MQVSTVLAIAFGFVYGVSSGGETLAIKGLNYNTPPIVLPAYTAFMCNQMWVFLLPLWLCQKGEVSTKSYWRDYLGLGVLTFIITILRNISVNAMPGSVFALLISTSIVFNIGISWRLGRRFNT